MIKNNMIEMELDITKEEILKLSLYAHSKDITMNQAVNEILESTVNNVNKTGEQILRDILRQTILTVTFIKKDSTERIMRCTLMPEYLIGIKYKTSKPRNSFTVFDMDKEQWRTINYETISYIQLDGPPFLIKQDINDCVLEFSSIEIQIKNRDIIHSFLSDKNLLNSINAIIKYTR